MKHWMLWLLAGIIAVVCGVWALINPSAAGTTTEVLVGGGLLVVGGLQGYAAYTSEGFKARGGAILGAAVALFLGLSLVLGPFGDGTVLRWIVGGLLVGAGIGKFMAAREIKEDSLAQYIMMAAAVSAVLGVIVLLGGLGIALGLIVALELLALGVTLIILSLRRKKKTGA
ncbi:hypothetical protein ROA7450_01191 [Roseovarius albus]|uniref:Acid-resistance membrane protein n=1 Tax=Roseovarius albus TaxID=1247867 RepID=A0A1X6YR46_9RHOB|nr:DUF308 domain-containing protein [Roseovarius albus]SLN28648.1 hypothetical protein ROA7450_01191 [Roseovarius albus]